MDNPENQLMSSLMEHGKVLALASSLSAEAKTQASEESQQTLKTIYNNVNSSIRFLLNKFENIQLPTLFREKAIPNILDKILTTLVELKEFDTENACNYEQLVKEVNKCKSRTNNTESYGSSQANDSAQLEWSTVDNPPRDLFDGLDAREKKCLFCFCLFPAEAEVKKREPIHLWVAMDLVADPLAGAEMLAELVDKGFIHKRNSCNGYKMSHFVRSMVTDAMTISFSNDVTAFSVMDLKQPQPQPQPQQPLSPQQRNSLKRLGTFSRRNKDVVEESGTLVLNLKKDTLQATTFEQISKIKNNIVVLHLGSWQRNSERYIVVEVEALKGLMKNIGEVTLLSLQGMTGIVKLPNYIYKLENLKVLDLRGCPNLEFLSEGIDSLKRLTHLDVSECYLLDHFPQQIISLTQLRVLKGFVINPQVGNVNNGDGSQNKSKKNASSSASFSELKALTKLIKLSIRARRNFPTSDDFDTLCAMKKLAILKISWSWNSSNDLNESAPGRFPESLKKLELLATPMKKMSQLLRLISNDTQSCLEKLYISGGRNWESDVEKELEVGTYQIRHVQTVHLRYLANLHIDWDKFRTIFPKLTRLEVRECPNLVFFPCDDNGIWISAN